MQRNGYTLIEILIVLVIMGLLFAAGYANYRDFSRSQQVIAAMRALRTDLRLAQEQALIGKKPAGCTTLRGYEFNALSTTSYELAAVCTSGNVNIKTVSLPTGISINVPYPNPIIFNVLGTGTNISTSAPGRSVIGLSQTSTTNFRSVIVYATGDIKESTETPPPSSTPTPTPTPTPIPPAVAWWKFDEGSGTSVSDSSGNGNSGTWGGTLGNQWGQGISGGAGNFDGTSNYVNFGNKSSFSFTTSMSVTAWIYPTSNTGFIFNKWVNGVEDKFLGYGSGSASFYLYNVFGGSQLNSSALAPSNTWTFIAATKDATTARFYINANPDTSKTVITSLTISNSTGNLYVGMNPMRGGSGTLPFGGRIDDVRLFNYTLSPSQIQHLYTYPGQP